MTKVKIKEIQKIRNDLEVEARNWVLLDDKIISYDIFDPDEKYKKDPKKTLEEEALIREEEEWREFAKKYQIRTGNYTLNPQEGMILIPNSDEKFYETRTSTYLKNIFSNFFAKSFLLREKFKKNKRAYLLYSQPGMGKSALIRNFCAYTLKNKGTAVVFVDGDVNFNMLTHIFLRPYADDVERIILVIEDFGRKDNVNGSTLYNPSCLNFLDGSPGLFRVPTMILCTTNYVRELGPHLTNRPGRFNSLIEVSPPTDDEIFELVEGVSGVSLSDEQKQYFRGRNVTPDHVIEAIIRHEMEDLSLENAIDQVLSEREGIVTWN